MLGQNYCEPNFSDEDPNSHRRLQLPERIPRVLWWIPRVSRMSHHTHGTPKHDVSIGLLQLTSSSQSRYNLIHQKSSPLEAQLSSNVVDRNAFLNYRGRVQGFLGEKGPSCVFELDVEGWIVQRADRMEKGAALGGDGRGNRPSWVMVFLK